MSIQSNITKSSECTRENSLLAVFVVALVFVGLIGVIAWFIGNAALLRGQVVSLSARCSSLENELAARQDKDASTEEPDDERVSIAFGNAVSRIAVGASHEHPRSSKWPAVRNKFIAEHQTCCVCGAKAEVVHHVQVFHEHPELELDPENLVSMCDRCHLLVAHLGDWRNVNPDVRKHVKILHDAKNEADNARRKKTEMVP